MLVGLAIIKTFLRLTACIPPCRKAAAVSVLFGKLSGAAGGGTIETILNQVATEPFRDQRAAADPYCLNPPFTRSSHQSALSCAAVSCTGCI